MKNILLLLIFLLLISCSTTSKVIPIGENKFSVSSGNASLTSTLADIKEKAYLSATNYCSERNKKLNVLESDDRPRAFGRLPSTEIIFSCINKN